MHLQRETVSWPQASHSSVVAGATLLPDEVVLASRASAGSPAGSVRCFPRHPGVKARREARAPAQRQRPILGPGLGACPWKDRINSGKLLVKDRKKISLKPAVQLNCFSLTVIKLVGRVKNDLCDLCSGSRLPCDSWGRGSL